MACVFFADVWEKDFKMVNTDEGDKAIFQKSHYHCIGVCSKYIVDFDFDTAKTVWVTFSPHTPGAIISSPPTEWSDNQKWRSRISFTEFQPRDGDLISLELKFSSEAGEEQVHIIGLNNSTLITPYCYLQDVCHNPLHILESTDLHTHSPSKLSNKKQKCFLTDFLVRQVPLTDCCDKTLHVTLFKNHIITAPHIFFRTRIISTIIFKIYLEF